MKAPPFSKADKNTKVKMHWRNFKNLFLQSHCANFELGTKHHLVIRIQVNSNVGPHAFPRADNYERAKIHWRKLQFFLSRNMWPILTKLGTKHLWVKGFIFFFKWKRGDNYKIAKDTLTKCKKFLLQNYFDNFNQTWQKSSLGDRDLALFQVLREDDYELSEINGRNLNLLLFCYLRGAMWPMGLLFSLWNKILFSQS